MNQSRASGSRRTRSQIGPDWTLKESLILVNEIVAVEGDCQNALSSFQKWNIIADNCTVLDVPRTSYQCRRKWDSLLDEYSQIKKWESQSRNNSFCSLEGDRRKEFGLPENFDAELFKAIDDHIRAQDAQPDAESDSDPDAEADTVDVIELIEEIEPKKQKRRVRPPESRREGKLPKYNRCKDEKPLKSPAETKPLRSRYEEKRQKSRAVEKPQKSRSDKEVHQKGVNEEMQEKSYSGESAEESFSEEENASGEEKSLRSRYGEKRQKSRAEEKPQKSRNGEEVHQKGVNEEMEQKSYSGESAEESFSEEEDASGEEKEETTMAKLRENAEFIHAIVNGKPNEKPEYRAFGLKNVKNFQADSVRRKGDALIACLGEISNTLHQLCVNFQNCD